MKKSLTALSIQGMLLLSGPYCLAAQGIRVSPDSINVNANGASVVFLTFGPLNKQEPAEACWCGDVIPAAPDLGSKCNPATTWGCLPTRLDLSAPSGGGGFTDILAIPNSVAMRAYRAAETGAASSYFYVRRFRNTQGGPDEYVTVTCRMGGLGARTPFALTNVKLSFAVEEPVLIVNAGDRLPSIHAEIAYNGTGRLKGRWEVVMPGEETPSDRDLLTEATLPVEERGSQRRYTQIATFNELLPPTGRYLLQGPDPSTLPNTIVGSFLVLLRIEATDDRESDSDLSEVGIGPGIVHSAGVAGFPIPFLRYFVGKPQDLDKGAPTSEATMSMAGDGARVARGSVDFIWTKTKDAAFYRLEVQDEQGTEILSALALRGTDTYRAPDWFKDRAGHRSLRWRVISLDEAGGSVVESPWADLKLTSAEVSTP